MHQMCFQNNEQNIDVHLEEHLGVHNGVKGACESYVTFTIGFLEKD